MYKYIPIFTTVISGRLYNQQRSDTSDSNEGFKSILDTIHTPYSHNFHISDSESARDAFREARVSISSPRDQAQGFALYLTTPPQTRKRKAGEIGEGAPVSKKQTIVAESGLISPPPGAPNTPPHTLTTMDSDDEFMSGVSSQEEDFGGTQQSDDDSLGDGRCLAFFPKKAWVNAWSLTRNTESRFR